MNRLKLVKLLWLADRYHLLKYGRMILKDDYYALENGPVPSKTLNIAKSPEDVYSSMYLVKSQHVVKSKAEAEFSMFSESDIEVLDLVWKEFGGFDQWELCEITHEYPEWKRFEKELSDPTAISSYKMELADFFIIPAPNKKNKAAFFDIPDSHLYESKQTHSLRKMFER